MPLPITSIEVEKVQTQLRLLYDALARSEALGHLEAYVSFLEQKRAQLRAIPTRIVDDGPIREGFGRSVDEQIVFAALILSARKTALGLLR